MRAILAILVAAPTLAMAQKPRGHVEMIALAGRASFSVPSDWRILSTTDSAGVGQFVYHIRNAAVDSTPEDRANVIVNIRSRVGTRTFKAGSDSLLGSLIEPSMIVLHDSIVGRVQRAVFWRGQIKATPYIGYDDIGQVGNVWVHIRIVMPLSERTATNWTQRFSEDTEHLLRSVRVTGRSAFSVSIGYPAFVAFGPGTARPNER